MINPPQEETELITLEEVLNNVDLEKLRKYENNKSTDFFKYQKEITTQTKTNYIPEEKALDMGLRSFISCEIGSSKEKINYMDDESNDWEDLLVIKHKNLLEISNFSKLSKETINTYKENNPDCSEEDWIKIAPRIKEKLDVTIKGITKHMTSLKNPEYINNPIIQTILTEIKQECPKDEINLTELTSNINIDKFQKYIHNTYLSAQSSLMEYGNVSHTRVLFAKTIICYLFMKEIAPEDEKYKPSFKKSKFELITESYNNLFGKETYNERVYPELTKVRKRVYANLTKLMSDNATIQDIDINLFYYVLKDIKKECCLKDKVA